MATQYALTGDWSADNTWANESGGVAGSGNVPANGDIVVFDSNSGAVTVNVNSNALYTLSMTTYTSTLTLTNNIDVDGNIIFGGTITGAGDVSCGAEGSVQAALGTDLSGWNGKLVIDGYGSQALSVDPSITLPAVEINKSAGTCTSYKAVSIHSPDGFKLSAGTYNDDGRDHTVAGDIVVDGGTLTSTGEWTMSADGDLDLSWKRIQEFVVPEGVTCSVVDPSQVRKLTVAGTLTTPASPDDKTLWISPAAANWWNVTGTVSCHVGIQNVSYAPGADIVIEDMNFIVNSVGSTELTLAGVDLGAGDLKVYGDGAGDSMSLILTGDLACNDVILGDSNSTGHGKLKLASTANVNSILKGHADNSGNEFNLVSASVTLTGTLDGDNISVLNTDCRIHGGTVQNVNASGTNIIRATDNVTDGDGNVNVYFGIYDRNDQYGPGGQNILASQFNDQYGTSPYGLPNNDLYANNDAYGIL